VTGNNFDHQLLQLQVLLPERGAGIEHGLDQLGDQRIVCNSLAYLAANGSDRCVHAIFSAEAP